MFVTVPENMIPAFFESRAKPEGGSEIGPPRAQAVASGRGERVNPESSEGWEAQRPRAAHSIPGAWAAVNQEILSRVLRHSHPAEGQSTGQASAMSRELEGRADRRDFSRTWGDLYVMVSARRTGKPEAWKQLRLVPQEKKISDKCHTRLWITALYGQRFRHSEPWKIRAALVSTIASPATSAGNMKCRNVRYNRPRVGREIQSRANAHPSPYLFRPH
jgi:hypothetical protein